MSDGAPLELSRDFLAVTGVVATNLSDTDLCADETRGFRFGTSPLSTTSTCGVCDAAGVRELLCDFLAAASVSDVCLSTACIDGESCCCSNWGSWFFGVIASMLFSLSLPRLVALDARLAVVPSFDMPLWRTREANSERLDSVGSLTVGLGVTDKASVAPLLLLHDCAGSG